MLFSKEVQEIEAANQKINSLLSRLPKPKIIRRGYLYWLAGSILGTFLFMFVFNLGLDFYYAVPSSLRFIKTDDAQKGVIVNTVIVSELQKISQSRINQIDAQGSLVGARANTLVGTKPKLLVQSSLLGVMVNSLQGEVRALPIAYTQSYAKGMVSNDIVGNHYYLLPFRLYVNGYQLGMLTNTLIIPSDLGSLFASSMQLIRQADNLLQVDINTYLNQATDREAGLRSYLQQVETVHQKLVQNQNLLKSELTGLKNATDQTKTQMQQTENTFFTALRDFDEKQSQVYLNQFVEDAQLNVDKKAHYQAALQLDKYFGQYVPALQNRYTVLDANREPLIAGIQVVAYKNVDLGLIKIGK